MLPLMRGAKLILFGCTTVQYTDDLGNPVPVHTPTAWFLPPDPDYPVVPEDPHPFSGYEDTRAFWVRRDEDEMWGCRWAHMASAIHPDGYAIHLFEECSG